MILILLLISNYVSFFLSLYLVFRKTNEWHVWYYNLLKLANLMFWAGSIHLLMTNEIDTSFLIGAIAVQFFCLISFWGNARVARKSQLTLAFSKNAPEQLVTSGYYKWVRHPYYSIYLLCYLSIAVVVNSPFLWVNYILLIYIYWTAAKIEEAKFFTSPLRQEYEEYKKTAWMFFPKLF